MNQISQYFGKNPKKRGLSDGSKTGDDDSKKPREDSSGSYTDKADILEEGFSADCRKVLFNCLKNLEQKINDLYMLANINKEMGTKGDKQLIDLTSSVEFLTFEFNELEKERKEKHELINSLQIQVSFLKVGGKKSRKKSR